VNDARLRALVDAQYASVWRLVRRLGVDESAVDDVVQDVFWVLARRLDDIQEGSERSFLYGVALRIAGAARRRCQSRREVPYDDEERELVAPASGPDVMLDERRARAMLDEILGRLPEDLRTVLVLHELEGLQVKQIAELVSIPVGTAGSRLRRAREAFSAIVKTVRARLEFSGDKP
jgi:RNA polymerase sigma-70 factor, ECF subfamily